MQTCIQICIRISCCMLCSCFPLRSCKSRKNYSCDVGESNFINCHVERSSQKQQSPGAWAVTYGSNNDGTNIRNMLFVLWWLCLAISWLHGKEIWRHLRRILDGFCCKNETNLLSVWAVCSLFPTFHPCKSNSSLRVTLSVIITHLIASPALMGGLRASARDQIAVTANGHSWQAVRDVAFVAMWVDKETNMAIHLFASNIVLNAIMTVTIKTKKAS